MICGERGFPAADAARLQRGDGTPADKMWRDFRIRLSWLSAAGLNSGVAGIR